MAELLDQKDIDELLNSNFDLNSTVPEEEIISKEVPKSSKIFKSRKNKTLYFIYPYRSPVIKRENVILNPSNGVSPLNGKIIVRDLRNYAHYLRKKNRS